MGAWSVSVTGNDMALDLKMDYSCAFYRWGESAADKIDEYIRTRFDETDPEEWCNYVYSLADYMWKKGILTDEIRDRAIQLIDSDFGLEIWAESGEKILNQRKKALADFRAMLLSPMGPKKKIKPDVYTDTIFNEGDIVAIQLKTANKSIAKHAREYTDMTDEEFHSYDGKYVLLQKIFDKSSWQCAMVPEIHDWWANFRLLNGIYEEIPDSVDTDRLTDATFIGRREPVFTCESSMFYFRKRHYKVIGNQRPQMERYQYLRKSEGRQIFLGISTEWHDPDSFFVAAMDLEKTVRLWDGSVSRLMEIAHDANRCGAFNYRLSKEENDRNREQEELLIDQKLREAADDPKTKIYMLHWGRDCAFASVNDGRIDNVYVLGVYQRSGAATCLLTEISKAAGSGAYMIIPDVRRKKELEKLCGYADIEIRYC